MPLTFRSHFHSIGEANIRFIGWSRGESVVCQLRCSALASFAGLNAPITEELTQAFIRHCNVVHEAASALFDIGLISRSLNLTDLETASSSLASGGRAFPAEMQIKNMVSDLGSIRATGISHRVE